MGRPSSYTPEIAQLICERLADGQSLVQICEDPVIPTRRTVLRWLSDPSHSDFVTECARARELQADVMDHRIMTTAEGVLAGEIDAFAGKVAISAFQWRASKLQPKVYGDATLLKHADSEGNKLQWSVSEVKGLDESAGPKLIEE